jgi:hypothetical protein
LERNIEATVGDKAKSASAYQKILFELSTVRIDHYAPLFREGQFWLQYNVGNDVKKEAFETEADRDFARKKLEASGATKFDAYSRADQMTAKNVPSGTMLADIMKIMKDSGAGEDAINDLIQLVVKAMPEASILKSRQKRTGIGGYVDNAAYVFDHVSSNTARQLARMQYGPELQRLVKDMVEATNQARGDDTVTALIVTHTGETIDTEELKTFCRQYLADFKVPRHYEFRTELPKTTVGKVLRRALVQEMTAKQ